MICPSCNNGILGHSLPKPVILTYRSFTKDIGTLVSLECSSCSYEDTDSSKANVDMDQEMVVFKREVNARLSGGELCLI